MSYLSVGCLLLASLFVLLYLSACGKVVTVTGIGERLGLQILQEFGKSLGNQELGKK